jgi:hypothetical protein
MTENKLSVQFGNLRIHVETASKRPAPPGVPSRPTATDPKVAASIIRCAPNAQVSRQAAEYATVCPSRLCWHCCEELSNAVDAKRLPVAYNAMRRAVSLVGYFCCWECAKAYSFDMRDNEGVGRRASILRHVFLDMYEEAPYISPALPKFAQRAFGGSMEADEYRRHVDSALNARPFMARLSKCNIDGGDWYTCALCPST